MLLYSSYVASEVSEHPLVTHMKFRNASIKTWLCIRCVKNNNRKPVCPLNNVETCYSLYTLWDASSDSSRMTQDGPRCSRNSVLSIARHSGHIDVVDHVNEFYANIIDCPCTIVVIALHIAVTVSLLLLRAAAVISGHSSTSLPSTIDIDPSPSPCIAAANLLPPPRVGVGVGRFLLDVGATDRSSATAKNERSRKSYAKLRRRPATRTCRRSWTTDRCPMASDWTRQGSFRLLPQRHS